MVAQSFEESPLKRLATKIAPGPTGVEKRHIQLLVLDVLCTGLIFVAYRCFVSKEKNKRLLVESRTLSTRLAAHRYERKGSGYHSVKTIANGRRF